MSNEDTPFILRAPLGFESQVVGDLSDGDSDQDDHSNHLAGDSGAFSEEFDEESFDHARSSHSVLASGATDQDNGAMDGDSVNLARGVEDRVIDFRHLNVEEDVNYIVDVSVLDLIRIRDQSNKNILYFY